MYSGVKQGANYVAVKAQPSTNKIKKGTVYMGHQVGGVYSNIKHKIIWANKGKVDEKAVGKKEENNDNDIKNENKKENEIKEEQKKRKKKKDDKEGPGILLNNPISNEPSQGKKEE